MTPVPSALTSNGSNSAPNASASTGAPSRTTRSSSQGPTRRTSRRRAARPGAGRRRLPEVAQDPAQQRGVDDHVDRATQPADRVEVVQLRGERRDRHELRGEREPAEQQLGHQLDVEGALREPLERGVQPVQRLTGLVSRHVAVGEHRDPALGHRERGAHLVGERREEPVPLPCRLRGRLVSDLRGAGLDEGADPLRELLDVQVPARRDLGRRPATQHLEDGRDPRLDRIPHGWTLVLPSAQGEPFAHDVGQPVGHLAGGLVGGRLDHHPDQGLGAGRPQQHPAAAGQRRPPRSPRPRPAPGRRRGPCRRR